MSADDYLDDGRSRGDGWSAMRRMATSGEIENCRREVSSDLTRAILSLVLSTGFAVNVTGHQDILRRRYPQDLQKVVYPEARRR